MVGNKTGRQTQIWSVLKQPQEHKKTTIGWGAIRTSIDIKRRTSLVTHFLKWRPADDDVETKICYACDSKFGWFNPSRECAISRKVCCSACCQYYIEPRLDGDRGKLDGVEMGFG